MEQHLYLMLHRNKSKVIPRTEESLFEVGWMPIISQQTRGGSTRPSWPEPLNWDIKGGRNQGVEWPCFAFLAESCHSIGRGVYWSWMSGDWNVDAISNTVVLGPREWRSEDWVSTMTMRRMQGLSLSSTKWSELKSTRQCIRYHVWQEIGSGLMTCLFPWMSICSTCPCVAIPSFGLYQSINQLPKPHASYNHHQKGRKSRSVQKLLSSKQESKAEA